MNSSESAEAIVKMMLEGTEVAVRLTGSGAKELAVLLYTMAKDQKMTKGKTKLNNMLKSGSQLQIFSLKEEQLKKFNEETKRYGVLYTALMDKKHKNNDGMVDIMVRAEDAPKVNRIVERFKLSAVDIASIKSEIEKDKIESMLRDAKERGVEIKSAEEKLADDIMTKPIQKESNEIENPNVAKTEKSPLSEHLSENKNKSGVATNLKKPSVREKLKEIKEEIMNRNNNSEVKETLKESKEDKNVDSKDKQKTTQHKQVSNEKKKKNKEKGR